MTNDRKTSRSGPMDMSTSKTARTTGRLSRDIQAKIGQQLRAGWDEVVKEGVPDRFAELLKRLDENKSAAQSPNPDQKKGTE
jgi:hypothetical protein